MISGNGVKKETSTQDKTRIRENNKLQISFFEMYQKSTKKIKNFGGI